MMRGCKCGLLIMILFCWAPMAVAGAAVSGVAAPAAKAVKSPEENYQAGIKAYKEEDYSGATSLFFLAAEQGHAGAQAEFAFLIKDGGGAKQAFEYFHKSADQGNSKGQFGLSLMYAEKGPNQDLAEALKWLTLAAEQGEIPAIVRMAKGYLYGGYGGLVIDEKLRSDSETLKWVKRAADADEPVLIQTLADAYRLGKYGLEVDLKKAAEWDAKYREVTGTKAAKKKITKQRF